MDMEDRLKTLREKTVADLNNQIDEVGEEAERLQDMAVKRRTIHSAFSAVVAVLGVAMPALVTYQTQVEDPLFKLLAILLTATVGASTALQATFRWGDQYRRTSETVLDLEELISEMEIHKISIERTKDDLQALMDANELLKQVKKKRGRIKREHVLNEIAIIIQEKDYSKTSDSGVDLVRSYGG